ncbi:MAG: pantetheine-phosphate adenylyltransferase [Candidatus Rokuibacteriota bacterium]|nr:MAG: pantetheine-phosphate adenylyltransferase [Candidatus Rokubacteria bacterium]PYN58826.1 MAG: pantetheine-phosphate adenylyltransferase [Candidatus Rokubacteria bacterium]
MAKRAVYPGMFDPVHNGHLDVMQRGLQIFDELIVAVVANPSKEPLFPVKERLEMIDEATTSLHSNFRIVAFDGLLIDLVARERADCIVRGIRAVSDFEYEFQMALMNRKLKATVETVFLMPHEKYTYISSRLIKEVASFGTSVAGLVPPIVEKRLAEKFPLK